MFDPCPRYGRRGHSVCTKDMLVGYTCSKHDSSSRKHKPVIFTDEEIGLDLSSTAETYRDVPPSIPGAILTERRKVYAFSDLGKPKIGRAHKIINEANIEKRLELQEASPGIVRRAHRVACNYCLSRQIRCSGDMGNGNGCDFCWRLKKACQYPKGEGGTAPVDAAVVPTPALTLLAANEESRSTFSNHSSLTDRNLIRLVRDLTLPWSSKPEVLAQMNPDSKSLISLGGKTKSSQLEPSPEQENLFGKSVESQVGGGNPFEMGLNKGLKEKKTENDPNSRATDVLAVHGWKSSEDRCLSFAQDDIEVLNKLDNDGWDALLHQLRVWFPSSYCEPFIAKQGPVEQHPVETTKPKYEPRPFAEDQYMLTYNLGNCYKNQGKLEDIEALFRQALEGKEKAWGPGHTSTLDTVNNLGNFYADQGKLADAEAMYQRVLEGKEKARGPGHTSTLDTVNNLGNLYADQGKLEDAKAMYQRALEGYEKVWGPEYILTLNTVNNLGNLYENQGKLKDAKTMYQRALEGYEKVLGSRHTLTMDAVNSLGNLYADQGKLKGAETMFQRVLEGNEKAWGPARTSTSNMVNSLSDSVSDFDCEDSFEAEPTASDLRMLKRTLQNWLAQKKGFKQYVPVPPLSRGGKQHLFNSAFKNHRFIGLAEHKRVIMKLAMHETVPQTYHFRPSMRGLQVLKITAPISYISLQDFGDGNKGKPQLFGVADNKADDQLKGLYKDLSPCIQRRELTMQPLIYGKDKYTPSHRDLSPKSIFVSALGVMAKAVSTFLAPGHPLDPEKTRIQWQCHCGYKSFDDFLEVRPGAARKYEQVLQRTQTNRDQSLEGRMSGTFTRFLGRFTKAVTKIFRGVDEDRDSPLPQHKPVDARQQQPQAPAKSADRQIFLLLCIPYRQYATKLLQLDLQDLQSDQNLFKLLRSGYQDIRGRLKSSLSLKTIKSIKFVQFEMYESELVDVRRANDIPPEDRRDEYLYRPMPADLIPPVGENFMLHLYTHPEDANASTGVCLGRIPKKLRGRLRACPVQGTRLGWGIHIIEGWHFNLLWLVAFAIVLLASLTFLICWAVLEDDLQGACGVATYMLAFATLTVGSVQAAFEIGL